MVQLKNNLYPIQNIRNVVIDRDKLMLVVYFNPNTGLYPVTQEFNEMKELDEKINELLGKGKAKRLLG